MLALALQYLNGWAMAAADGAKKEAPEWPPHPDRIFMALAAAHFETDGDDKAAERGALEWLESLGPPEIAASGHEPRKVVTHFVPVNDQAMGSPKSVGQLTVSDAPTLAALKKAGLALLPEHRARQPRGFPVAIPHEPTVYLIWPEAIPSPSQRRSLEALCRALTHVGHSASFVSAWLADDPPAANWIPVESVHGIRLRVPSVGRLAYLVGRCDRARAIRWADLEGRLATLKPRVKRAKGTEKKALKAEQTETEETMARAFPDGPPVAALDPKLFRPDPGHWQSYGPRPSEPPAPNAGSIFDPNLLVLRLTGHRLSVAATLNLTATLRSTIMKRSPIQPPPAWLSGHAPDGRPSAAPHAAFVPLPFVGASHADGRVLALALVLPREAHLDPLEAVDCLGPILRDEVGQPTALHLFDGNRLDCWAELETRIPPPQRGLDSRTWTRPALRWASVTPVVFDRHFEGQEKWELAAEAVKTSCERIGLPRPEEVLLHPVSLFEGVPRSNEFPRIVRKSDGGRMHHSHAVLVFPEPIMGPVLVGAGRFRGYGLCRPLPQGGHDD